MSDVAEGLAKAIRAVTQPWAQIKKQEVRERHVAARQAHMRYYYGRSLRVTIKDAAAKHIPAAYDEASGGGRYPATTRQVMYRARPLILAEVDGRELDDVYFTQQLLPDYVSEHEEAAGWDVVYDERGHLREPHNHYTIGIGTLSVRSYLRELQEPARLDPEAPAIGHTTSDVKGPGMRYGAVLFIEKEGFLPLLEQAGIQEKYDLAIASSKGLSSTAARRLLEELALHVKVLCLHDFDKAGFSIIGTLMRSNRRYQFSSGVNVIDLGLRLSDVEEWKLASEPVAYRSDPESNLRLNGATPEEIEFLRERRVELNAFTSDDFIAWLEAKLEDAGVGKVIPEEETLRRYYRRMATYRLYNEIFEKHREEISERMRRLKIPEGLREKLEEALDSDPEQPWDMALAELEEETA